MHSGDFQAEIWPNARLAGLVSKTKVDKERRLVPMLYAEVNLPKAPAGKIPKLTSKLPDNNWVFAWDARRHTGYLLALPRARRSPAHSVSNRVGRYFHQPELGNALHIDPFTAFLNSKARLNIKSSGHVQISKGPRSGPALPPLDVAYDGG